MPIPPGKFLKFGSLKWHFPFPLSPPPPPPPPQISIRSYASAVYKFRMFFFTIQQIECFNEFSFIKISKMAVYMSRVSLDNRAELC